MIRRIEDFATTWGYECESTLKLLRAMTDDSLSQPIVPGGRTLGFLAWHITQSIPEMLGRTGLMIAGPGEHDAVPASASQIARAYEETATAVPDVVRSQWNDETLFETDDMYGQRWNRGTTLDVLIRHQTHHRGQMTVLMRQAGLPVAGAYGPSREEWVAMGMQPMP